MVIINFFFLWLHHHVFMDVDVVIKYLLVLVSYDNVAFTLSPGSSQMFTHLLLQLMIMLV